MRGVSFACLCIFAFLFAATRAAGLTDDFYNFLKENVSVTGTVELLVPTLTAENEKCREHSQLYLRELKNFRLWATEMFDATAKLPSGILHGSSYNLGNFDECVEVKVPYKNEDFTGKYCLAKFTVKPPNYIGVNHNVDYIRDDYTKYYNISTWEKITVFAQDRSKSSRNDFYSSFCLPSSCTNEDLKNSLVKIVDAYSIINDIEITVEVDQRSCQIKEPFHFDVGDIIFMAVIGIFVFVVLAASTYHLTTNVGDMHNYKVPGKIHKFIMCFSFPHNLKKLASKSKNEDGLNCLSGLKTLSMFFVIAGHRCMFIFGAPMTNPKFIEEMYTRIDATVFLNGPIIVDTFFVISGFLATYMTIHFLEKRKLSTNLFAIYFHRLIRMTPAYAVVLAFYCTIFVKIGSGPFWQDRVGLEQERCVENWWTNLLYINNYVNVDRLCMFQSWYMTCDMHYFLLMPFLVWLLRKKQTAGIFVIAGLLIASICMVFVTVYMNEEDGIMLLYTKLLKDPVLNKTFRNIYMPSHLRASPYLVGILTAYIKYKMKVTDYKMPKQVVYVGWTMCVFIVIVTVYTAFIFYIPGFFDNIFSAVYASLHHFTFSLCMAWIILAVSSRNGGWIKPILSWKPLLLFSRITYTAFLAHGAIQIFTSATMRVPRYVGVFQTLYDSCSDIVLAYVAGFILSMYFEAPIIGLEKMVFQRDREADDSKTVARRKKISGDLVINIPKIKTIADC